MTPTKNDVCHCDNHKGAWNLLSICSWWVVNRQAVARMGVLTSARLGLARVMQRQGAYAPDYDVHLSLTHHFRYPRLHPLADIKSTMPRPRVSVHDHHPLSCSILSFSLFRRTTPFKTTSHTTRITQNQHEHRQHASAPGGPPS